MTIPMTPASDIDRIAGLQTEARNASTADIDVVSTVEMMGESAPPPAGAGAGRGRACELLLPPPLSARLAPSSSGIRSFASVSAAVACWPRHTP